MHDRARYVETRALAKSFWKESIVPFIRNLSRKGLAETSIRNRSS